MLHIEKASLVCATALCLLGVPASLAAEQPSVPSNYMWMLEYELSAVEGASQHLDDECRILVYSNLLATFEKWGEFPDDVYVVDSATVVAALRKEFAGVVEVLRLTEEEFVAIKSATDSDKRLVVLTLTQASVEDDMARAIGRIWCVPSTAGMSSYYYRLEKESGKWRVTDARAGLQS